MRMSLQYLYEDIREDYILKKIKVEPPLLINLLSCFQPYLCLKDIIKIVANQLTDHLQKYDISKTFQIAFYAKSYHRDSPFRY